MLSSSPYLPGFPLLFRGAVKLLIACFVLWHMAAIGIFSLQNVESQPILRWLEAQRPLVRPYVLITSQWQRWNLFSPDPLRRVTEDRVDLYTQGTWTPVRTLDRAHWGFFRRAAELKIARRLEEEDSALLNAAYLADICRSERIAALTPIRLVRRWFVIPLPPTWQSVSFWRSWEPEWQERIAQEYVCPPLP